LYLLAGERAPASNLADAMNRNKDGTPPDQFGDLGWWYYLAGYYQQALKLLEEAVQRHPGEGEWLTDRAWVQIQNKTLLDALQNLDAAYSSGKDGPDRKMARAVAFWLSDQKDAGLREFAQATAEQPEWTNSRWVRALYSPLVGDAVQQMQAEQERLKKLQQARLQK
jgi:tetratricopeptide (TPR) repeat protein